MDNKIVGFCKECYAEVTEQDSFNHNNSVMYECPRCGYPQVKSEMFDPQGKSPCKQCKQEFCDGDCKWFWL